MAKMIIVQTYGAGFQGTFEQRFDSLLVDALEKYRSLPATKTYAIQRQELLDLIVARCNQLDIDINSPDSVKDYNIIDIASGTRFMIADYDGSEYIITESNLTHVAP